MRAALDLALASKANALFHKVGQFNWRSLAANDCAEVNSQNPTDKTPFQAYAIFYLDPA